MTAENDDDNDNQQAEGSQLPESPPRTGLPRRTASSYSDSGDSQDVTTLNQLEYCVYGRATTTDWNEDDDDDDDEEDWSQTQTPQPHHTIDVKYLRKLASRGIPDEGSQRGVVWRLLLNYLPDQTDEWSAQLQASRAFYHQCVTDLHMMSNMVMLCGGDRDEDRGVGGPCRPTTIVKRTVWKTLSQTIQPRHQKRSSENNSKTTDPCRTLTCPSLLPQKLRWNDPHP